MLSDADRLEIAMSLLSDYEIGVYEQICRKRKLGCPDGLCEACLMVECPYPDPQDNVRSDGGFACGDGGIQRK